MSEDYVYTNMRIKSLENSLLKSSDFESMLSFNSQGEIFGYLKGKGWKIRKNENLDEVIKNSEVSLWNFVKEATDNLDFFKIILLRKDFSNLKAIIRGVLSDIDVTNFLDFLAIYDPEDLYKSVKNQQFDEMPPCMEEVAREAFFVLLKTSDACLCDAVIDKGMFVALNSFVENKKDSLVYDYMELLKVYANINISLRAIDLNKNTRNFLLKSIIPCNTFDYQAIVDSTLKGKENLLNFLNDTVYKGFLDFSYDESEESLNDWLDFSIFSMVKSEITSCFGIEPIFAYVLLKYLEFKNLRIVFKNVGNVKKVEKLRERFRVF